jgi:hypothetical protein
MSSPLNLNNALPKAPPLFIPQRHPSGRHESHAVPAASPAPASRRGSLCGDPMAGGSQARAYARKPLRRERTESDTVNR